jgi:hypothetical protein
MLLAVAVILAPATAVAQGGLPTCGTIAPTASSPFVWAFANNACRDLSSYLVSQGDGSWSLNTPKVEVGRGVVQLNGNFDSDPFITFGATTINGTAGPITYASLFGTPITPGFYSVATSTGGVSVTNGARGNATVTTSGIYPTFISGYGTVGFSPTNLGVDLGTASCNATGVPFTVTTVCNQGSTSNTFATAFYDNLEGLLTYTQDDAFSVASWSGAVTIDTVTPEPATIGLFGLGLVVIGGLARRRRTN